METVEWLIAIMLALVVYSGYCLHVGEKALQYLYQGREWSLNGVLKKLVCHVVVCFGLWLVLVVVSLYQVIYA